MKSLYFVIFTFLLILFISLYATYYLKESSQNILNTLDKIEYSIKEKNFEEAKKNFNNLKTYWFEQKQKWSTIINHNNINEISVNLEVLENNINFKEKKEALDLLIELQCLVKNIPLSEYPTLENIL